jgi:hypothetical protein
VQQGDPGGPVLFGEVYLLTGLGLGCEHAVCLSGSCPGASSPPLCWRSALLPSTLLGILARGYCSPPSFPLSLPLFLCVCLCISLSLSGFLYPPLSLLLAEFSCPAPPSPSSGERQTREQGIPVESLTSVAALLPCLGNTSRPIGR